MELTANINTLKPEINLMQSIAERKLGGALSYILLESDGKTKLRITATDLSITIQSTIKADIKTEGTICVPAKKMSDIIKSLDTGDVKFKSDATNYVKVTCNTSKWRVAGLAKDQFPTIPEIEANEVVIDGDAMRSLITHTCFAITQEENRFNLSGAKLEIGGGLARMIATDGSRIALMEDNIDDIEAEMEVLIPKKALQEVSKLAGNEVVIYDSPNHIKFESGDRVLITSKMAMNFPNYQMALPQGNEIEVNFAPVEMVKALKRVAIVADERHKSVKLLIQKDKMIVSATGGGEAEETVKCTVLNFEDDVTVFLNWQFLSEYLNICDKPAFKIKDGSSAVEVIDSTSRYIVMPLRAS